MNLIYRRITYIFFIIIFLILAPTIILYTQGWRYNFKSGRVQKTGVLVITSDPKKATVSLNNKTVSNKTTPAKIKKLLPADYEIKLIKEGYHTWSKKLPIYANTTTFAEDILMWKKSIPLIIDDSQYSSFMISPKTSQNQILAITDKNKIDFYQSQENTFVNKSDIDENKYVEIIQWAVTGKKLLAFANNDAKKTKEFILYNLQNQANLKINLNDKYLPDNTDKILWDFYSDNIIYSLNNQGIWQTDIFQEKYNLLYSSADITDFIISGNNLYILKSDGIYFKEKNSNKQLEKISSIQCSNCVFLNKLWPRLILLDKEQNNLYLIDPQDKKEIISINATGINILNENTLLIYNDWEIFIYENQKNKPQLITRLSKKITQALWHPQGRHIFIVTDNKIQVIELDNRELRNIITLTEIYKINQADLISDDKIYFIGQLTEPSPTNTLFELQVK